MVNKQTVKSITVTEINAGYNLFIHWTIQDTKVNTIIRLPNKKISSDSNDQFTEFNTQI